MSDLKPCPFCGELPDERNVAGNRPKRWKVECVNDECAVHLRVIADTPEEARRAWNRRLQSWLTSR
jgi:hypothetical protein